MAISGRMDKEEVVHIHNGILFSHKKEILPSATWMQLEDIMLSEISQVGNDKCQMISLICEV